MNILKTMFLTRFPNNSFSEMTGMQHLLYFIFKLLLRPWDLSHRVECQQLMVTSQEETAVPPQNGLHIEGAR